MKKTFQLLLLVGFLVIASCKNTNESTKENASSDNGVNLNVVQEGVKDDVSNPNIVQVASASKDHTTLVAAVKAAGLVNSLSNAGPFTVFAPTNAAFYKLPAGTVEGLLKPEKKPDLENILGYHTYVGNLKIEYMQDGQEYDMVYGGKVKITKKGDKTFVNGSEILATIATSNGIIHVIGDVLLPPK
ncbi:fasciclin domain-containing protein [Flavobacterium soyangense]|uniref:Fasciclin domain-containing protein n=1 Tax=Flavobacterium soyangense TaxID=2023265 RepID=A0A930UB90_9FLAO|nr:fasciclin domain-containing protein [Flavobacterium soyangense]MBF2708131.1 fasciclin domain-containing protein [Flavobacterium soyangense]